MKEDKWKEFQVSENARELSSPLNISAVSTIAPNLPQDWGREAGAGPDHVFVDGKPLSSYAPQFNNFNTEDDVKEFFKANILCKMTFNHERDKENCVGYLMKTFHQGGFLYPVSAALAVTLPSSHLILGDAGRNFKVDIITTSKGFTVQEDLKAEEILVPDADEQKAYGLSDPRLNADRGYNMVLMNIGHDRVDSVDLKRLEAASREARNSLVLIKGKDKEGNDKCSIYGYSLDKKEQHLTDLKNSQWMGEVNFPSEGLKVLEAKEITRNLHKAIVEGGYRPPQEDFIIHARGKIAVDLSPFHGSRDKPSAEIEEIKPTVTIEENTISYGHLGIKAKLEASLSAGPAAPPAGVSVEGKLPANVATEKPEAPTSPLSILGSLGRMIWNFMMQCLGLNRNNIKVAPPKVVSPTPTSPPDSGPPSPGPGR